MLNLTTELFLCCPEQRIHMILRNHTNILSLKKNLLIFLHSNYFIRGHRMAFFLLLSHGGVLSFRSVQGNRTNNAMAAGITGWNQDFIYLCLFIREEGGETGRQTPTCGCLLRTPYWGPGLQPRHVPWLGIELETFWFTGQCSIYWATPASADFEGFTSNTKSLDFTLKMVCKGVVCILFRNIQAIENGLEGGILGVEIPDRG